MLSHQKDFHKKSQANDDEKFLMMPSVLLTKDFSPKMMNHKMVFKWRYTKYFWKTKSFCSTNINIFTIFGYLNHSLHCFGDLTVNFSKAIFQSFF